MQRKPTVLSALSRKLVDKEFDTPTQLAAFYRDNEHWSNDGRKDPLSHLSAKSRAFVLRNRSTYPTIRLYDFGGTRCLIGLKGRKVYDLDGNFAKFGDQYLKDRYRTLTDPVTYWFQDEPWTTIFYGGVIAPAAGIFFKMVLGTLGFTVPVGIGSLFVRAGDAALSVMLVAGLILLLNTVTEAKRGARKIGQELARS